MDTSLSTLVVPAKYKVIPIVLNDLLILEAAL